MNSDLLFSIGNTDKFDSERDFYSSLGLELGDLIAANIASCDLIEVQSRLLLIVGKFQKDKAPPHIAAMLTVILRVILERQRIERRHRSGDIA
ncbi:hypothetical protein FHI69_09535 [Janthinobacterium lividum]|uniref:Uncharacterized protein n=1 Tax=Janthinobacterium lividum TaxID=29581 RepID=A0A5C4NT09_9BURK|nr:hypothetical protein [Janthinobacterium lividum]TNC77563.1 hypothetical protein FHI69_09535 [Janthinobacterium lividum]